MTTIEKLQAEAKEIQNKIKTAEAITFLHEATQNKSAFGFNCPFDGEFIGAVENDTIWSCGDIAFRDARITHVRDLHKICFDAPVSKELDKNLKQLRAAIKQVVATDETHWEVQRDTIEELTGKKR